MGFLAGLFQFCYCMITGNCHRLTLAGVMNNSRGSRRIMVLLGGLYRSVDPAFLAQPPDKLLLMNSLLGFDDQLEAAKTIHAGVIIKFLWKKKKATTRGVRKASWISAQVVFCALFACLKSKARRLRNKTTA